MSRAPDLGGATVVVTRRAEDAQGLAARVTAAGGRVECVPMIEFAPPADAASLDHARRQIVDRDWLVLTSRYAARALLEGVPVPAGRRPRVAALGKSTTETVAALGWPVDLDGGGEGADALADKLATEHQLDGTTMLYPRSDQARSRLPEILRRAGAEVSEVEAYRNLRPGPEAGDAISRLLAGGPAVFVFASPSAAQHLDAILVERARPGEVASEAGWSCLVAVSIGPTTSRALRALGAGPLFEAATPDDDGLMAAVCAAAAHIAQRAEDTATGEER